MAVNRAGTIKRERRTRERVEQLACAALQRRLT